MRGGLPRLTIRERPELAHYRPRFAEPGRPNASPVLVGTPSGVLDLADPELAAELGPGVRAIKCDRGVFDTMPLSRLTTQTMAGRAVPAQLRSPEPSRTSNLLLDGLSLLIYRGLRLGEPVLQQALSAFCGENVSTDERLRWS